MHLAPESVHGGRCNPRHEAGPCGCMWYPVWGWKLPETYKTDAGCEQVAEHNIKMYHNDYTCILVPDWDARVTCTQVRTLISLDFSCFGCEQQMFD